MVFAGIASAQTTITSQVAQGNDDAEERVSNGNMDLGSSDLELTSDGGTNQYVGIRFQNINIPQGTTILSASIQFTTDETDSGSTSVTIRGDDSDNASIFSSTNYNISSRTLTSASVAWNNIPSWNTVGQSGANQQTPSLTAIVQEIVNRGGWSNGNSMAFIINGSGERTAEAYNGDSSKSPVLTIVADFTAPPLTPLPAIIPNLNRGLPYIYYMADNRSELYAVAPDPTASPLPSPTVTNITYGGSSIIFSGEGGGYRSTDRQVYVFEGDEPTPSSDMYSIDPTTGVATLVKTGIVPGHVEGAEFYINNNTGEEVLVIVYNNGTSGGADRIMAINPNVDGSQPAWSPYSGYPIVLSGARTSADGISWNPDTAEFYIQNDNNVDYYTVDITTGVTTYAFTTSSAIDGEGITYASDGTNYIEDENNVGLGRTIFIVNTTTGALTPAAQLGSTGDVESIMGNLGTRNDAGDAPATYGYAAHLLPVLTSTPISIYLGSVAPDSENPFMNFSIGNSDDNTGDDEDGVTSGGIDFSGQVLDRGTTKVINIITNGSGVLSAWIDFNRDGDFDDPGEQIATNVAPSGGGITLNVAVPGTASIGTSYARFRFSSDTGLPPGNSEASNGEVEDYQVMIQDDTACPLGSTLYETTTTTAVYATSVVYNKKVLDPTNALGNNNTTLARFKDNDNEMHLEMGQIINSGKSVTVHGPDGDDFDIWVSASATGPWTQVGNNAVLDFTFISPFDWLYIRFKQATDGPHKYISYVDASSSTITTTCVPDTDNDGTPDNIDLDNDNDGIPDLEEANGNNPYGDEDGDGNFNWEDTVDNGNGGDGSPTNYADGNSDGVPDVYDSDLDGVPNHLDLDSDNDGIYDAVEAGHNQSHTNGVVNSGYGANGLANVVETAPESGIINYTLRNTDGTSPPDYLDSDSDGDGCNDANEAYANASADGDGNGFYGTGNPPLVNPDGTVTSAAYTVPADGDGNGTPDYREAEAAPVIDTQPTDESICEDGDTFFSVVASNVDTYQWQFFNGSIWVNLTDSGIHSGSTTNQLNITNAQNSDDGNQYRVIVSNSSHICDPVTSNSVNLTVNPKPTITVTGSPSCNLFLTAYSLQVTVSTGTVTSTAGTVTNTSGNVWSITNVPEGANIVLTVTDSNGCIETLPVTAPDCSCPTVNAPNSGGNKAYCSGSPVATINATVAAAQTVDWYDAASAGTLLLAGSLSYTPSGPGTYYAEARNTITGCLSATRTAITITEDTPSTATIGPDKTAFVGDNVVFTASSTNADTYQWQLSTDGGVIFNNIADGVEYAGTQTNTLTVKNVETVNNGYRFRILASKSGSSCTAVASSSALLTVQVKTVITNRRITHRVKKN